MMTRARDTHTDTITRVEPVVSDRESGPERFAQAGEISNRFLDNIETVVYGKRDEIKLVLTALVGHREDAGFGHVWFDHFFCGHAVLL